ncbi:MAG: glutamate-1-semialdehyde 2,1-aminomutase [Chitinophagaceae bacterium]|jgi:glutamate-1-semialdehyde 2,1-aminomutase
MEFKSIQSSINLFERAKNSIPGGVNSPVRAFKSVGGNPLFIKSAQGAYLYDEDGNRYIDYINSWGPMILGHAHPEVIHGVQEQIQKGFSYGAPTALEIEMAELVKSMVPNMELIRMVSSGTEACMSALRLARGYTGRNKFIKFEGCYHGHADPFLVKAGSGVATFNIQTVPGVTATTAEDTITVAFNDLEAVNDIFSRIGDQIAAVFVEPVAGNMGCVPPNTGFLEGLRAICNQYDALLVFDEVMTGFRLAPGGVQQLYGIEADLVTYGKVIGGGLPVGAFGGKKKFMELIAPLGSVYQAGTLSGNPLAVTAGIITLSILKQNPLIYESLKQKTHSLGENISSILKVKGIAHTINQVGSMISIFFGEHQVKNFKDASETNIDEFNRFFHHMLKEGIYLPPSAYETWFISDALEEGDIQKTLEAIQTF